MRIKVNNAEHYDIGDRFAKYPSCPDCGCRNNIEVYSGEISEDMQKDIDEYNLENGLKY